jgi:hypothetical protein
MQADVLIHRAPRWLPTPRELLSLAPVRTIEHSLEPTCHGHCCTPRAARSSLRSVMEPKEGGAPDPPYLHASYCPVLCQRWRSDQSICRSDEPAGVLEPAGLLPCGCGVMRRKTCSGAPQVRAASPRRRRDAPALVRPGLCDGLSDGLSGGVIVPARGACANAGPSDTGSNFWAVAPLTPSAPGAVPCSAGPSFRLTGTLSVTPRSFPSTAPKMLRSDTHKPAPHLRLRDENGTGPWRPRSAARRQTSGPVPFQLSS